jgi:UbiD family decarboxylase
MNRPEDFSSRNLTNAPKQDLRTWLSQMEAADELQVVRGANRDEEIGGIVDFYQRRTGNKAVLFDDIPGYPSGYRALANILTSTRRIKMTLGLPDSATDMELVNYWRRYMKENKTIPPVQVPTGLVMENVYRGADIDLTKIPAPKWHELDGGYYIGTGDMVIMRHPDTGWINYGAYRVQVHDKHTARSRWCAACIRRCSWWRGWKSRTARTSTMPLADCWANRSRPFRGQ